MRSRSDIPEVLDVLEANRAQLLSRARRLLHEDARAEDVVQDVALLALSAPNIFEDVENVAAWLSTVVTRRSIDLLRRLVKGRTVEKAATEEEGHDEPDTEERTRELERAVAALPEPLRYVVEGNVLQGKPFRVLSQESGLPMGTLMARKQRAVALLREILQETPDKGEQP